MSLNNQVSTGQSKVLVVATEAATTVAIPSNTYDNVVLVGAPAPATPAVPSAGNVRLPLLANCLIGETVTVSTIVTTGTLTVNQNSAEPALPSGWTGGWVANGTVAPGANNVAASGAATSTIARSITLCVDTAVNTGVTYKVWRVVSVN